MEAGACTRSTTRSWWARTEFDAILARITERGITYFADPLQRQPGEINRDDGGRGVYWLGPDGHVLEAITRPYGG